MERRADHLCRFEPRSPHSAIQVIQFGLGIPMGTSSAADASVVRVESMGAKKTNCCCAGENRRGYSREDYAQRNGDKGNAANPSPPEPEEIPRITQMAACPQRRSQDRFFVRHQFYSVHILGKSIWVAGSSAWGRGSRDWQPVMARMARLTLTNLYVRNIRKTELDFTILASRGQFKFWQAHEAHEALAQQAIRSFGRQCLDDGWRRAAFGQCESF